MKTAPESGSILPLVLSAVWIVSFSISCMLFTTSLVQSDAPDSPTIAGLLGESRFALSGYFYEVADKYFHAGRGHVRQKAFEHSIFQRAAREISPEEHVHISRERVKEMMPWLWLAVRANPNNVETYLVAAFWLANDADRPDLALEVLQEAQWNNPFNYRVQLERGRLLATVHDFDRAKRALDAGLAFWPGDDQPDGHEALLLKSRLLIYRAMVYTISGSSDQAIVDLEEILELYPERAHIRRMIEDVRTGKTAFVLARQQLDGILKEDNDRQREAIEIECSHHHRHHDDG
jgi:tetratricopeptide (TPR) repeat protein